MEIKIISYTKNQFIVEDVNNKIDFKIPALTLIKLLNLNPDVLYRALVDRKYIINCVAVEK